MNGRATTTVSIYRGSSTNAYGDDLDDNSAPIASGQIASIIEQSRRTFLPAENRTTVVENATGRVKSGTNITEGDRIKDEKSGRFYLVEGLSNPSAPRGKSDIRLVLRAVNL